MFDYIKQRYLNISMILTAILFTSTIANASYNSNWNSKQKTNIYSKSITFINLEKTPDEIVRSSETDIIHSIEQKIINKK